MPFRRRIRVSLQHGGHNEATADVWTLAYYYQQPATTLQLTDTLDVPGARLQGLWLGNLMATGADCGPLLSHLTRLVAEGRLHVPIDDVLPWTSIATAADRLMDQTVHGKLVLRVA